MTNGLGTLQSSFLLVSPLTIPISSKTNFSLNMNIYRNAHHMVLNNAKNNFKNYMLPQIQLLPNFKCIEVSYTLYVKTKRKLDISNICCVVDKFFSDALVEEGKLPDDNYKHIPKINYFFGGYDKDNPRVEINIKEI